MPDHDLTPLPLVHVEVKGTAGVFSAAFAVVCQMAGMGILQLAYMLRQGGWVCLALIVSCALATNYTGKLLVECCYDDTGARVNSNYAEIGFAAFGRPGRMITRVFESATLFGVSSLFLILGSKFLRELLPLGIGIRLWILISGVVVSIPVLTLKSIGELKAVSFIGVASVGAVVLAVVVEASMASFDGTHSETHTDIFIPEGFVPAFSAMALAFAAHAGLPQVEASMKDPKRFAYSFNFAYALVLFLYLPVAVIGYAVYGNGVYSPILCSLPQDNWVQQAAKALVTLHVLLTYPVLMTLLLGEVENSIGLMPGEQGYLCKRSELRALFVAATIGVAAFVPYFDTMMSLVGAICVVMTTFVMPAVFYLKIRAKAWAQQLVPILVALLGTVGGIVGAVQASVELWDKASSGADPNSG